MRPDASQLKPLMICYYYPPLTDVGCNRSIAFAKYFKKHDWHPSVISVKNPDKVYCRPGNLPPPKEVPVTYTYSIINLTYILGKANGALTKCLKLTGINLRRNYLYDFMCVPDQFWGWIPFTILKSIRFIKHNGIDFIYVSCSPFSSAIIGVIIKFMTKKPIVIDFRDPFALDDLSFLNLPSFKRKINRRIEKLILKHADLFVVTTKEMRTKYIEQYPQVKEKIFTVYNGFDSVNLPRYKARKFNKFTIVYTGEFYFFAPQDNELFFKALAKLKQQKKIHHDNFQFLFYGDARNEITDIARKYSIEDIVIYKPRIPYREVLEIISRSHLQLLRIVKLMISTKFFEGISLNTPFLATIPSGEVEQLIRKYSPSSSIITDESVDKVAEAIQDSIAEYQNGQIKDNLIDEFLSTFSRENQTVKLMTAIRKHLIH